ncbi:MAG: hypothetical protein FJ309_01995 [Planctomycetes bacterium]|nr:hypothetical protein [Planctomycetota bacterium]
MKRMFFLGALALSVTVCSQSYGFEILNRMLGHKGCTSCTEPACDAGNGCADACEPTCAGGGGCFGGRGGCLDGKGCAEPSCDGGNGCSEPACDAGVGNGCCEPSCGAVGGCGKKKHNLFGGLKGLFDGLKRKHHGCTSCCSEPACGAGNGCAEPACGAGNGCEPACGAGNGCAEPACGAGNGCCEPSCGAVVAKKKHRGTPILDLLKSIHSAKKRHHGCTSCCDSDPGCGAEPDCAGGNGCCEPACGAVSQMVPATSTPDASAAKKTSKVVAVSRTVSAK